MNKPFYEMSKSELRTMMQTFTTVATANAAALGLSPAQITEIGGQNTLFNTSLNDQTAAQAAAKGAVADCTLEKGDTVNLLRRFNAIFKANPAVSDELLDQLGLPPRNQGGDHLPVFAPTNLAALGCSNGVNSLTWNNGGNFPGVNYVVEASLDKGASWDIIDVVTTTKMEHFDQTPGVEISYRVYAKRRNIKSAPSNVAIIYQSGGGQNLSLKVA
ncbi:MAG: fibronectin type III domain-containing protein [Chthonomonadaceae bacterium]|nr:fibronectin type III domain-containing protein [Chthonomonadaceae bacterium]